MKEFLGIGGYTREPEGFLSWQHLLFVGSLLGIMVILAVLLGRKNRLGTPKAKNTPLVAAALLINAVELFKIAVLCIRDGSAEAILYELPLFLCSIQLITIPLAAFAGGRVKEASLDFVCIFGILGAIFGTIGAGQNYNCYPVLSLDNVTSGITHCISGFASLYILIAGLASMKKRNIGISYGILMFFCVAAYIANVTIPYNYMFLMTPDGTPYEIVYSFVNGSPVLYPALVILLFLVYIALFYLAFYLFRRKSSAAKEEHSQPDADVESAEEAEETAAVR